MIEFTKIFCDLHPNELISNYCAHCTLHLIQNNATFPSVPPVSVRTPSPISKDILLLTIKTSEAPTPKCRTASGLESQHFSMKNQELYLFSYLRILSSKTFIPREEGFPNWSCKPGTRPLTLSTNFTMPSKNKS